MSGPVGEADGGNGQVHREVASHAVVFDEHLRAVHHRFIHRVVNQIAGVAEIEIEAGVHDRVWGFVAAKIRGIVIAAAVKRRIVKTGGGILKESCCALAGIADIQATEFDLSSAVVQSCFAMTETVDTEVAIDGGDGVD